MDCLGYVSLYSV